MSISRIRTAVFIVLCVSAFGLFEDISAVSGNLRIKDLSTGTLLSLSELKGKYRLYMSRVEDVRDKPGNSDDTTPEERRFIDFLGRKYLMENFSPDDVSFDLVSDTLKVVVEPPFNVVRRRGLARSTSKLYVILPLERKKARKIMSDNAGLTVRATFHLNRLGEMVIDNLRLYFDNKEFYRE
jgi:hypothetical protein